MIEEIKYRLDDIDLVESIKIKITHSHPIYMKKDLEVVAGICVTIHKINKASCDYLKMNLTALPNLLYMSKDIFFMLYSYGYIDLYISNSEIIGTLIDRYKVCVDFLSTESIIVLASMLDNNYQKINLIKRFNLID